MRSAFFAMSIVFSSLLLMGSHTAYAEKMSDKPVVQRAGLLKGKRVAKTLLHENVSREYYVHLPVGYTKDKRWPVLFVLHGGGGSSAKTPFDPVFSKYGFIGVLPDAKETHWNDGRKEIFKNTKGAKLKAYDDVAYVDKLIDQMIGEYNAEPSQMYVSGMSNGGLMTQRLAMELSHRIAAFGVVTANLTPFLSEMKPEHPTPIMFINGTADSVVPYHGGVVLGNKGAVFSTDVTIDFFLRHNGCTKEPRVEVIPDRIKRDKTTSQMYIYDSCDRDSEVVLINVEGGGHTWPGHRWGLLNLLTGRTSKDFSATEKIIEFCQRHIRPSAFEYVKPPESE